MTDKIINLNLDLNAPPAILHVTQGDTAWCWHFRLFLDGSRWSIPTGAQIIFKGLKPDGHVFAFSGSFSGEEAIVTSELQMTICAGEVPCSLIILDANAKRLAFGRITMYVAADAEGQFDVASESALPAYVELLEQYADIINIAADIPDDLPGYIQTNVNSWLVAHPEATTTVQDGAVTKAKLAAALVAELTPDATLTVSGKPADAKATGDAVDDVKSAIQVSSINVEQGTLNVDSGVAIDTNSRIRTTFFRIQSPLTITIQTGYQLMSFAYESDMHTYLSATSWRTGSLTLNRTDYAFRIAVCKTDNTDILPDEFSTAIVMDLTGVTFYLTQGVVEEKLKSLNSKIDKQLILYLSNDYYVESGTLATGGSEAPSFSRIRTGYLKFNVSPVAITLSAGYEIRIFIFDADFNFVGASGWVKSRAVTQITNAYYRIVIRKSDGADIYPNDFVNVFSSGLENAQCVIPSRQLKNKMEKSNVVDVILFSGQSNMAGRGITNEQHPETYPTVPDGYAYEFKAITDPTKLFPLSEPFGKKENKSNGINDGSLKTGSLVSSFAIAYYEGNGNVPLICVSASKGDSGINQWQINSSQGYLNDAIQRFSDCVTYLTNNGFTIRHKFLCWCQGEHDYDMPTSTYADKWQTMYDAFAAAGIEKCLLIRIGNDSENTDFEGMINLQTEMAQTNKNIVMVSTDFAGMKARGMMKDKYHYYQDGYNECGTYAGINAAIFATTEKEPVMYDPSTDSLYYSHKN